MKIVLGALALIPLGLSGCATTASAPVAVAEAQAPPLTPMDERIAHYAQVYDIPESVIRGSIEPESGYNPKARNGPYWGLMQIRVDTARSMGYRGAGRGLLDADTNLKYAVAYLSNAYMVAGRDPRRARRLYTSGYYWEARRKGLLDQLKTAKDE